MSMNRFSIAAYQRTFVSRVKRPRIRRWVAVISMAALLPGCAGVGVFASSDPFRKLNDAEVLFEREDRPLIAERLIFEAMEIYQARGDCRGLGASYREYGDLLHSTQYLANGGVSIKIMVFATKQ
jgi:hypothetical protein